jgi:uncharacterized protein CbrC (UPF0167 family)
MKISGFRHWCQEKWYEHQEEIAAYGQPVCYTAREYFLKYKFWLKREYKHQQGLSK